MDTCLVSAWSMSMFLSNGLPKQTATGDGGLVAVVAAAEHAAALGGCGRCHVRISGGRDGIAGVHGAGSGHLQAMKLVPMS